MGGDLAQIQLAAVDSLCHALGIETGLQHGVTDGPCRAHGQHANGQQVIHQHVGHGDVHLIDAIDAQQTANGTLHRHGGVLIDKVLGILSHALGRGTSLFDQF